jgi:hypothetical protein
MIKLSLRLLFAISTIAALCLSTSDTYAQDALGEINAKGEEVVVQLSDGSEITLKNGEEYPLYPSSIITTKEDSQAVLKVEGGTYVIEQKSTFIANLLSLKSTSLSIVDNIPGEACYCFQPNAPFLVDTLITKTTPHQAQVQQANYKLFVQGRTDLTEGNATAYQLENKVDFATPYSTFVIAEGEEKAYPKTEKEDDEEDVFESRDGCCVPGAAVILTTSPTEYILPIILGTAVITGTIIGVTSGDGDGTSSNVTP